MDLKTNLMQLSGENGKMPVDEEYKDSTPVKMLKKLMKQRNKVSNDSRSTPSK